jgi:3-hydroxyisobutyrate dehydrogenase
VRRLAFIGLGDMGRPMAANLLRAGFEVIAYDVDRDRLAGFRAASTAAEAVAQAEAAIVMVRTLDQVSAVLDEIGGSGIDVAVMSTIDPTSMERFAAQASPPLVDAPVSGGVAGAEAGSLTIMAAGPIDAVERFRPAFEVMGRNIFVIGERPGMGQAVKLANQLMLAACVMGALEGIGLAARSGLTPDQVVAVIAPSTGDSWALRNFDLVRGWFGLESGQGPLAIIGKDLRSIEREAHERGLDLPVARLALEQLEGSLDRAGL